MTLRSVPPNGKPKPQSPNPLTSPQAATDKGMMEALRSRPVKLSMPRLERLCRPSSGRLWVLGGSQGSYKTQLAWTLALNAAKAGQRVLFASLEMTVGEMALQAISRFSGIELNRILGHLATKDPCPLADDDKARMEAAVLEFSGLDLTLRLHGADEDGRGIQDVLHAATRVTFDLVVVDHLRMISGPQDTETGRVADAIEGLRALSRGECRQNYRPMVLAVSPLNREPIREAEEDEPRMPRVSDFWGSSRIEYAADVAMILRKRRQAENETGPDVVEGFVLKNRQGREPLVLQFQADGARCLVVERRREDKVGEPPGEHWSGP